MDGHCRIERNTVCHESMFFHETALVSKKRVKKIFVLSLKSIIKRLWLNSG